MKIRDTQVQGKMSLDISHVSGHFNTVMKVLLLKAFLNPTQNMT